MRESRRIFLEPDAATAAGLVPPLAHRDMAARTDWRLCRVEFEFTDLVFTD